MPWSDCQWRWDSICFVVFFCIELCCFWPCCNTITQKTATACAPSMFCSRLWCRRSVLLCGHHLCSVCARGRTSACIKLWTHVGVKWINSNQSFLLLLIRCVFKWLWWIYRVLAQHFAKGSGGGHFLTHLWQHWSFEIHSVWEGIWRFCTLKKGLSLFVINSCHLIINFIKENEAIIDEIFLNTYMLYKDCTSNTQVLFHYFCFSVLSVPDLVFWRFIKSFMFFWKGVVQIFTF